MLKTGEVRALRRFYEKFADQLYCFLMALCGSRAEAAEDLCQEVWISFAGKVGRMKGWNDRQVLAWLRLTARVKYRRYIRKKAVRCELPASAFQENSMAEASAEDVVLAQLLFKETFEELTPVEKELIRCKIRGTSYRDRHPEDGRSANALAVRCSRALRKWRRGLAEAGLESV